MGENNKRILIWCGNAPNQAALVNRVASRFGICGLVVENKKPRRTYSPAYLADKLLDRTIFGFIGKAWRDLQAYYNKRYPSFPKVDTLEVADINSEEVYNFSRDLQPHLIVVSGTSLIRKRLLSLKPSIGIINLHTGLSPFVKGGPNCTNWCIANNEPHHVGNTVMWIDAGIDSGNVITTSVTGIDGCQNLFELHIKVMEDAHRLCIGAIEYLLSTEQPHINIRQSNLGKGNLYLTRMWTWKKKWRLKRNLHRFLQNGYQGPPAATVALPEIAPKNIEVK